MPSTNQQHSPAVAAPPDLAELIADLARRLYANSSHLNELEKQMLLDLQRPGRYQWAVLKRLAAIAARSPDGADREALPEYLRSQILLHERCLAGISLIAVEDEEVLVQADEDRAQRERWKHDDPVSRSRLFDALRRRFNVTRRMMDALEASR